MLNQIKGNGAPFDILIIGGGATGLGAAVDAISRGYSTLLIEQKDFASGTSSRSSKLIHGGLRYLKQGKFGFVKEALHERTLLFKNAPHLVHPLPFLIPTSNGFEKWYYRLGLKAYDALAGEWGEGASAFLDKEQTLKALPSINSLKVNGSVSFMDGQFEDARLAICLALTLTDLGGTAINYMKLKKFIKVKGKLVGIIATDEETGAEYEIRAKVIINAAGTFSDAVQQLDDENQPQTLELSRGTHLVFDRCFYPSDHALLIPRTEDGRLLFIIPWLSKVLLGTTDIPVQRAALEPVAASAEIDYLLSHAGQWLTSVPKKKDLLSVFSGIRPLVKPKRTSRFSSISREHALLVSPSNLLSVLGGKWTTYRKMGETVINKALEIAHLPPVPSQTEHMRLHGFQEKASSCYGADAPLVETLGEQNPRMLELFDPEIPCRPVDVIWAVRHEMARKLEDILARRTRSLFLGAGKSMEIAPKVASWMAKELHKNSDWEENQVEAFTSLAKHYLCDH